MLFEWGGSHQQEGKIDYSHIDYVPENEHIC